MTEVRGQLYPVYTIEQNAS